MSATISSFSTFSPSYENISNRMNRLKQHRSAQSLTQIRPNSARKVELNVFSIDPYENTPYQPRRRLSPTNVAFTEDTITSTGDKYAGRVTKNTGLKKYNQRQLRQITDCKNPINLKTEGNSARGNYIPCVNQNFGGYNLKRDKDEIKIKEQTIKFCKSPDTNLIPGRIYTRQALSAILA